MENPSLWETYTSKGRTILHIAIEENEEEAVEQLIKDAPSIINMESTNDRYTPLHFAVLKGHLRLIELLLNHKDIRKNKRAVKGQTPLLLAASLPHENKAAIIHLLLENGVSVNVTDENGYAPIHYVVTDGNLASLKDLILFGANVHQKIESDDIDVLQLSIKNCQTEIFHFLIEHDPLLLNHHACFTLAIEHNCLDISNYLISTFPEKVDVTLVHVQLCIFNDNYDLFCKLFPLMKDHPKRLLSFLVSMRMPSQMKYIMFIFDQLDEYNFDELLDNDGTLLHKACKLNLLDCALLLFEYGASLSISNENQDTPLHLAAQAGHLSLLKELLLQDESPFFSVNHRGSSLLHLVTNYKHTPLV
eukprot:CAMPEP_0117425388 /NCGR_PEP_ID=MMETSP0758-20121206/5651_1 /TAXON_ID=63605 /ORGANISM="Percolomonas cosmopolitus, Strain AE-1 (ATCC 50343)" /LENGTH=360 /DNA_ID=CAMNT_0005209805 /DNA_START=1 /DNA_END=1080 /DNA_ORIENTATION=+